MRSILTVDVFACRRIVLSCAEKDPRLVWRGAATGVQGGKPNNHRVSRIDVVRRYSSSPGIDVGFTESFGKAKYLEKDKISKKELLKHKYLLSMEGNDIASGLKWMLLSNSVVFMAKPEHESWAMEVRPASQQASILSVF